VAGAAVAHALEDLAHAQRHRGLAGAGRSGEAHVQRGDAGLQAELQPHLVDDQQRGDLAHALLDRPQTDQVVIELVQDVLDALFEHEVIHGAGTRILRDVVE